MDGSKNEDHRYHRHVDGYPMKERITDETTESNSNHSDEPNKDLEAKHIAEEVWKMTKEHPL